MDRHRCFAVSVYAAHIDGAGMVHCHVSVCRKIHARFLFHCLFMQETVYRYALGIYLLNLFLAFLTPKFDPSLEMDTKENEMEEGPSLPTKADEEFKPFIRRLPEFKFW